MYFQYPFGNGVSNTQYEPIPPIWVKAMRVHVLIKVCQQRIKTNFLLLNQFTLACIKMGRADLAQKALNVAEKRLQKEHWPEYYDTRNGKFIGKQSRLYQTWTIAGFLTSKMLLENPERASLLFWEEDYDLLEICVCALSKSGRKNCSRSVAKSQILVQWQSCYC